MKFELTKLRFFFSVTMRQACLPMVFHAKYCKNKQNKQFICDSLSSRLARPICIHNALPLGANLLQKNYNIKGDCVFGCDAKEDDNHLFLGCPHSRHARLGSNMAIRSDVVSPLEFCNWLVSLFQQIGSNNFKDHNFVEILSFAWAIYTHRNEILFLQ